MPASQMGTNSDKVGHFSWFTSICVFGRLLLALGFALEGNAASVVKTNRARHWQGWG